MSDESIDKTTIYEGVIGDTIRVDRRRSDGMVWLRVTGRDGTDSQVTALDAEQAWGLARALMQAPEPLDPEEATKHE